MIEPSTEPTPTGEFEPLDVSAEVEQRIEGSDQPHQDVWALYYLYHEEGKSLPEVADELGCTATTIHRWMEKHNIDRRNQAEAVRNLHPQVRVSGSGYTVARAYNSETEELEHVMISRLTAFAHFDGDLDEFAEQAEVVHHKMNSGLTVDFESNLQCLPSHLEHSEIHTRDHVEEDGIPVLE